LNEAPSASHLRQNVIKNLGYPEIRRRAAERILFDSPLWTMSRSRTQQKPKITLSCSKKTKNHTYKSQKAKFHNFGQRRTLDPSQAGNGLVRGEYAKEVRDISVTKLREWCSFGADLSEEFASYK
jgi:hypothetical protein